MRMANSDSAANGNLQEVQTNLPVLKELEGEIGRPLADWTPTELRTQVQNLTGKLGQLLEIAESLSSDFDQVIQLSEELQSRSSRPIRARRVTLASLLKSSKIAAKNKRGRPRLIALSDQEILKLATFGRLELRLRTDRAVFTDFMQFVHQEQGKHTVGKSFERKVQSLRERASRARKLQNST